MKRITFAVATTLSLGAITITLPKLKSDVQANPVANQRWLHSAMPAKM